MAGHCPPSKRDAVLLRLFSTHVISSFNQKKEKRDLQDLKVLSLVVFIWAKQLVSRVEAKMEQIRA